MLLRRYEQRKKARWQQRCRELLFTKDPARARLAGLLAVSLVYLLAEFAFSAWIVEATAVNADAATLWGARVYGCLLTGCAIALVVWPMLRDRGGRGRALLFFLLISGSLAWAAHAIERAVLAELVRGSSAQARAAAVTGMLLRQGLAVDAVDATEFEGLWHEDLGGSVPGKSFAALAAFLAAPYLDGAVGAIDVDEAYARFVRSQLTMQKRFQAYRDPDTFRRQAIKQWESRRPARPAREPANEDRAAFIARTESALRQRAGLDGLPPGLSLGEFAAHPRMQAAWRAFLAYPDSSPRLSLAPIGRETFAARYYRPVSDARQQLPPRDYGHQPAAYGNGAERAAQGRRAFELMVAPMLGLALSMFGILLHVCRGGLLLMQYASGWRFRHAGVELVALLAGIWAICQLARFLPMTLAAQPAYASWAADGGAATAWLDAVMRLQTFGYPLFDFVLRLPR
ncbi:hypothetical protein AW878_07645 [Bordetella pseudohinzii]|uniref:Uncharacterized protein n=2 Tax=Bordetella pseudohinzii TaxID=1331258 RepID=A0A0J6C076_9BORD|nr:hypothetical protein BBN53_16180 [Bordetella pseudohinzii]KMM24448.1 hypothetical protein L540_06530 [Bordetella pseudohinzii]KXA80471.1 hypothetical protein AW878_07645 [Bordetella pseudohinzii]KXA80734.1 hypothetical protein AW877_05730 [Bordetella pseudohinzii]CUI68046.1 Uncharacterised protein [Bordetella pseudohinzii]